MKSVPLSRLVLGSALISIATVYSTDLLARDKSSAGVSGGGASVSADRGGASASAGNATGSAGRGGASASAGNATGSAGRGGASASVGSTTASAGRGGASGNVGNTTASVDRGGVSVSANRGGADVGTASGRMAPAVRAAASGRPVGDRSYDSLGEWFQDLRLSWFGGRTKRADEPKATTTHTKETSESGSVQVHRVVQKKSSTVVATEGGSASAEAENHSEIEQKN